MLDYWNTANNGRIGCMFLFCFFTNHYKCTRYRYKKTWTAESRPEGPASNCTSFFRRITNKYRHATVTNIDGMHQNAPKHTKELLVKTESNFFFPFIPKWQERVELWRAPETSEGRHVSLQVKKCQPKLCAKEALLVISLTRPCGGTLGAPPHSRWHWRGWRSSPGTCREARGGCMSDCSNTWLVMKVQFNVFLTAEWSCTGEWQKTRVTERPWSQVAIFIHFSEICDSL